MINVFVLCSFAVVLILEKNSKEVLRLCSSVCLFSEYRHKGRWVDTAPYQCGIESSGKPFPGMAPGGSGML